MKKILLFLLILGIVGFVLKPKKSEVSPTAVSIDITVVSEGLNVPWEIVFLPDGDMLVTERTGDVTKISVGGEKSTLFSLGEVEHTGEGGLLGMALHPDFEKNHFIYLYLTTSENGQLTNKVLRYKLNGDEFSDRKIILEGINGAANHDGGRIVFGPDGLLYVTTGDAQREGSAQDKNSLNGKILRVEDDGENLEVYSYGHRNPQGLAWDEHGQLWATEHGPSGTETGNDELNLIEKGGNYGWPLIRGTQTGEGMITPVIESGKNNTWAPAGLAYLDGSLYFGGLRGEALYEAKISNNKVVELKEHFKNVYGRIRAVVLGPDGFLYISTSNRDGRGSVNSGDDKIIKINAKKTF